MTEVLKKLKQQKLFLPILLLIIFVALFVYSQKATSPSNKSIITTSSSQPLAAVDVNKTKEFNAQVYRETRQEKIDFTIKTAELKKEIRVKEDIRKAREDKLYLLLRIELVNNTPKRLTFITSDYIRMIGTQDKKYAPDFHNGVVIIDPLSVRNDIVAFIVDKNQKQVSFLVGELEGEKEKIDIKF